MSQITLERLEDVDGYIEPDEPIFLVTGKQSYETSGAKVILDTVLASNVVTRFSEFSVNPKLEDIESGIDRFRDSKAKVIFAVGGGSALDVAKSIRILASQAGTDHRRMVEQDDAGGALQGTFIAAPTTAGTGSEATHFAVVYIDGAKYSLAHPDAVADIVILDSRLTADLPPAITAATGMDAISQATEAFWSVNSTDESRGYSSEALKMLLPAITKAVRIGDEASRSAMLHGANLAGKAINIAKTTACHAVSYPMTSRFGIPHGHAVGLTLPSFMEFNASVSEADVQDRRGAAFVNMVMGELFALYEVGTPTEAREKLESLMDEIGLERRITKLGIDEQDIDFIVEHGFNPQRVKNNPRNLTAEQLRSILQGLL